MNHAKSLVGIFLLPWFLGIHGTLSANDSSGTSPPAGFRSLFNGQNLDGWVGRKGNVGPHQIEAMSRQERAEALAKWTADAKDHWSVKNGELVNDGSGAYLVTKEEFTDYELRIEFKTVPRADSGIYLKATPQVQIWDYTDPAKFNRGADLGSGGLFNNSPESRGKNPLVLADKPFGQWNSFRIIQVGARTTVYLNDQLVVDHVLMENYWDRDSPLPASGPIELQTHGGEIRWRNIFIRELSPEQANAYLNSHRDQAFRPIFNGQDLTGWQNAVDDYEVVDGVIRCKQGRGGLLVTEEEFANFIVRLEFRLPSGGNNGLAIRSPGEGNAAYQAMTELQVLDNSHPKYAELDPRQYHGSAYGMVAAERGYLRDVGEWNFQQVTVDGSRVKVELNGNIILDADLAKVTDSMNDRPHPGKDRTSGYFGFAGHNEPVEFRNLSVRELP